jgi:predicted RNase H-like nuclease
MPDGVCLLRVTRKHSEFIDIGLVQGDEELLTWLKKRIPESEPSILAIDAPLIVPNATRSRPVDRQISAEYGKHHAACHSANSNKCVRPLRIAQMFRNNGYSIRYDLTRSKRAAIEVYPHPAMIHLFELDRIIKYKKGKVAAKREEFKRLQELLSKCLKIRFRELEISPQVEALLKMPWTKSYEDQTDALFCALLGYLHWDGHGNLSRIVGSLESGFIVLPPRYKNGIMLMFPQRPPPGPSDIRVTMELVNKLRDEE